MSADITDILRDWAYEPGNVTVRKITADDGRPVIQMRLDLGVLQFECTGRPDGTRPYGHESLLDYHQHQRHQHMQEAGSDRGFQIDETACEQLRTEGMMYYHRYLAEFILGDYDAVERDALRNIELFDFCAQYAKELSDRYMLEQYRPYVIMMCTRARARRELASDRPKTALAAVKDGIGQIEAFYRRFDQADQIEESNELGVLRTLAGEIMAKIPVDPVEKLRRELARAVEEERYEDAAALRDRLHQAERPGGGRGE